MPPKSSIIYAYGTLRDRLYGSGVYNMLAMTYLKPNHRAAYSTGYSYGNQAVQKLIKDTINDGDVVLTYKYSVLASNPTTKLTSPQRNFQDYMEKYIYRVNDLMTTAQKSQIRSWTASVLTNAGKTLVDPAWKRMKNAYNYAMQLNSLFPIETKPINRDS